MRGEQRRKPRGIAARHAALGGDAVHAGVAAGGGEALGVAFRIVVVDQAEIELGLRSELQLLERCEIGFVGAPLR